MLSPAEPQMSVDSEMESSESRRVGLAANLGPNGQIVLDRPDRPYIPLQGYHRFRPSRRGKGQKKKQRKNKKNKRKKGGRKSEWDF